MTGLYTGAMGMVSNMAKLNVHANNISNNQTSSYKADQETFRVFDEATRISKYQNFDHVAKGNVLGSYNDSLYVDYVKTSFTPGTMKTTVDTLDLYVYDEQSTEQTSFFLVEKDGQQFLTRNGDLMVDADGKLMLPNGALYMDENDNPIVIPDKRYVTVNEKGELLDSRDGTVYGQLQLKTVQSDYLGLLEKTSGGLYRVMTKENIEAAFGPISSILNNFDQNKTLQSIFQNKEVLENLQRTDETMILQDFNGKIVNQMLEGSNVDMAKEMVELMKAQKGLSAAQKVVMTFDKILEKEANNLG